MWAVVETCSLAGFRADLVAQPNTLKPIKIAPKLKPFSFRSSLGKMAANVGALLFLATPASASPTALTRRSCYSLGRFESDMRKMQRLFSRGSLRLRIHRKVCEHALDRDWRMKKSAHRCRR